MKNLIFKLTAAAVCVLLVLDLTGGTLAQPERTDRRDRWIGFQLVYEKIPRAVNMSDPDWETHLDEYEPEDHTGWVEDRNGWEEYGSEQLTLDGFGTVNVSREVLFGRYDQENARYVFPGKEGFNCFLAAVPEEEWPYGEPPSLFLGQVVTGYRDMRELTLTFSTEEGTVKAGFDNGDSAPDPDEDAGEFYYLHGKVYLGPPLDDTNWNTENHDYIYTAYRVYQTPDGRVYLDGHGNSYGGVGGIGSTSTETYTVTSNGKPSSRTIKVGFTIEGVERLTQVSVTWFGGDNAPLSVRALTPEELGEGLELPRPAGAVWALVEEKRADGTASRAIYTLEEEPATHDLILLDDRGLGYAASLTLR